MRIGRHCKISKGKYCGYFRNIHIGDHVFVNTRYFFHAGGKITIGSRVIVGFDVSFITGHHEIGPAHCRCGNLIRKDIHIEDGVWIGSRALIGPGVTVGKGSVVAAGAVVMHSIPSNTVVGGVPAKVIRTLEDTVSPNDNVEPTHREKANE
jgi:acetyltransferase-like isoleucine patch superfamily enzyme